MVDLIVERLAKFRLDQSDYMGTCLREREKILKSFRDGSEKIVVATDVQMQGFGRRRNHSCD